MGVPLAPTQRMTNLYRNFLNVGVMTTGSRILGFVRDALVAAVLGTGPAADAYLAAFRFPNLFRRLFAEGAFNTAFIPLFAKSIEQDGMKISMTIVTAETVTTSQLMIRAAHSLAGSMPSCSSDLANSGMKAVLKAPSANSRRKRLGKRKAAR